MVKFVKFKDLRDRLKGSSRFFPGSKKVLQIALSHIAADEVKDGIHKASEMLHGECGLFFTNEEVMRIF